MGAADLQNVTRPLLTACIVLFSAGTLLSQTGAGDEQRLKAAFVFRFPQFVTWPSAAISGRNSFDICVAESQGTATALREITSGESQNGLPLRVRENPVELNLAGCHVLVLPGSRPDRDLLKRAAGMPILTVGDSANFLDEGGIIQLKVVDRRVRFEISMPAAVRAGVTLSSQLLRLASQVRGEP